MRRRGGEQRGFAMLLVFVMAAAIAITLYKELPRVAFEAQRDKEQLLIQRGEQYSRAIQLYVRKLKKYPATMEDLENTNQVRFLRKRYIDPMTGKSEWRVVHVGPGGIFLDSLVHKPPSVNKDEQKAANTFTYEAPTVGSGLQPGQAPVQTGPGFQAVRPSEQRAMGMLFPGQSQTAQRVDPSNPQNAQLNPQLPPQVGYPGQSVATYPGAQQAGGYNPNQPGGYPPPPGVPGAVGGYPSQPGFVPLPGQAPNSQAQPQPGFYPTGSVNSQTGGVFPSPYSTQPGAQGAPPPFGQPGTTTNPNGQPVNPALGMIQQLLTTPRAGGLAGATQPMAGAQIGGGIAGVASTVERSGIKVYNEKEKYNEWEFLYDLSKDTAGMGGAAGLPGSVQQQGTQGQSQGQQNQSLFGAQPGFGGQPAGAPNSGSSPIFATPPQQQQLNPR